MDATANHPPRQACLVTSALHGPAPDGRAGFLFRQLAALLVGEGWAVTVLLARGNVKRGRAEEWREMLRADGIDLHLLGPPPEQPAFHACHGIRDSYRILRWLRHRAFGLVVGQDARGLLYYPLLARDQGWLPGLGRVLIACTGPSRWEDTWHHRHVTRPSQLEIDFQERQALRRADAAALPGDDLEQWFSQERWQLPARRAVIPGDGWWPPGVENPLPPDMPPSRAAAWTGLVREMMAKPPPAPPASSPAPPRVTVILTHFNRPDFLGFALDSLRRQSADDLEVILADDGSRTPRAVRLLDDLEDELAGRGWTILRLENGGPSRARNLAAEQARGDYLLFMDDDNVALPHEVAFLAAVAHHTGADVCTCLLQAFEGHGRPPGSTDEATWVWLPLGPSLAVSAMANCLGDTNFLIRRSAFHQLGGFAPDPAEGQIEEDWQILSRALLAGLHIELVPEPLYWYRRNEGAGRALEGADYHQELSGLWPYRDQVGDDLFELLRLAHGTLRGRDEGKHESRHERRLRKQVERLRKHLANLQSRADAVETQATRLFASKRWKMANLFRFLAGRLRGKPDQSLMPGDFRKATARYQEARSKAARELAKHHPPPADTPPDPPSLRYIK